MMSDCLKFKLGHFAIMLYLWILFKSSVVAVFLWYGNNRGSEGTVYYCQLGVGVQVSHLVFVDTDQENCFLFLQNRGKNCDPLGTLLFRTWYRYGGVPHHCSHLASTYTASWVVSFPYSPLSILIHHPSKEVEQYLITAE